ncbi:hypothetical protein ACOWPH_12620 [Anabaena sp. PCC 7938]|uniref:hypothetical protein n=1 Tax=Anabaena sp. PCC 7938 TaxID=1296340 RepID=UPI00202EE642|nr:hypothetical protein [Anabaena sp. CCAP 1446/1C]MCM2409893.1 hypothetical protein [Anabaena sp. CCAP 1446/1C]
MQKGHGVRSLGFLITARKISLGRGMTKLPHTSLTSFAISFLVMNLSTLLSRLFWGFLCPFFQISPP